MNIKSQARELNSFLHQTRKIWLSEIMNEYPHSIQNYNPDWLEMLSKLTPDELYAVDSKIIIENIAGTSFEDFMNEVQRLSKIKNIEAFDELPLEDWAFNGIKKKKRHEIQKIVPVVKNLAAMPNINQVVDIGGGVGHLSRVLSHYHGIPTLCLDRNAEFQKIGIERLKKYRRIPGASEVKFINFNFGDKDPEAFKEEFKDVFTDKTLALGLHTCGSLANTLIQKSIDHKMNLLSFGCCYHQLNPNIDFPLSTFYKEQSFEHLNLFGLSLATRAHSAMSLSDYKTKERVKQYRYALHLFLMKHFDKNYFTEVGECNIRVYWEPFCLYIRSKLAELKIEHDFSDEYFNSFYENPLLQKELKVMFLCNIIRWQIGRVLEIFVLLDRCLYLEENGYDVTLEQYFEEPLSPRNIGIKALKL